MADKDGGGAGDDNKKILGNGYVFSTAIDSTTVTTVLPTNYRIVFSNAETDTIDISDLGDDKLNVTFSISKRMLAQKSPVFQKQFCGPLRNKGEKAESLYPADYSMEAWAAFFRLLSDNTSTKYDKILTDCGLFLEVLLLADMYQVQSLYGMLKLSAYNILIKKENVVFVTIAARKYKDLSVTEAICKDIIRRCVEFIHYNQVNIWENFRQEDDYKDAACFLALELNDFREKAKACNHGVQCTMIPRCAKKLACKNCGTLPCLKNQKVEILNSSTVYNHVYTEKVTSSVPLNYETVKGSVHPNMNRGFGDSRTAEYSRCFLTFGCT